MLGQRVRHISAARLSVLRKWMSESHSFSKNLVELHAGDGCGHHLFGSSSKGIVPVMTTRQLDWRPIRCFSSDDDDDRRSKIQHLVEGLSADNASFDKAKVEEFVDAFFDQQQPEDDGHAEEESEEDETVQDETSAVGKEREDIIMRELKGLRRGSRRVVLQKLLQGGILQADPAAAEELKKIEKTFRPPAGFRMKVVHINRTCKGTRSGGLFRFSALVVVGNGEGVLGWGSGKSVEVGQAVQKAHQSAYKNLYPVPRHNNHTVTEPVTATFGKTKVIMYPKSSGRGIRANPMLADICRLAGIHDVGVKVHGSRNPQNTVKCLFAAFDSLRSQDEITGFRDGILTVQVPTGRFGQLNLPRV